MWDDVLLHCARTYTDAGQIDRVTDDLKALYATVFEIDSDWLIKAASRRHQ